VPIARNADRPGEVTVTGILYHKKRGKWKRPRNFWSFIYRICSFFTTSDHAARLESLSRNTRDVSLLYAHKVKSGFTVSTILR